MCVLTSRYEKSREISAAVPTSHVRCSAPRGWIGISGPY